MKLNTKILKQKTNGIVLNPFIACFFHLHCVSFEYYYVSTSQIQVDQDQRGVQRDPAKLTEEEAPWQMKFPVECQETMHDLGENSFVQTS